MSPKLSSYIATVLPGMEQVAASEITAKIWDASIQESQRGKVLFKTTCPLDDLFTLRSVDNLYIYVDRFHIGPHRPHLQHVEALFSRMDLHRPVLDAGMRPNERLTFVVNASRAGKHSYSRFELAEAAARGVAARHPRWQIGTPENHRLEFRLDLTGDQGLLSLRLTPPTFRFRGEARAFSQAALRPTVAHALVWLARPTAEEVFLDPFCGSGTIVAERATYPARRIVGGDLSADVVSVARGNIAAHPAVSIEVCDARSLPLDAGSVDTVVSNVPFGRQILTPQEVNGLYRDFLVELCRVLSATGRAYLLTDQGEGLIRAADSAGMVSQELLQVSLKGLRPKLYQLKRA